MERKRYLELCQKYATGEDIVVKYMNIQYHPKSYELSFDGAGNPINKAILQDTKANSVTIALLSKVEEK